MKSKKIKSIVISLTLVASILANGQTILAANEKVLDVDEKNNDVIQQQLDAFDEVDSKIKANRSAMVLPDKTRMKAGTYPTRNGVILVTKDGKAGDLIGHAGIIWTSSTTVESFPDSGVKRYSNSWNTRYSTVYGVTTSGTSVEQDNNASNIANSHYGKPYNWNFLNTNTTDSFYCSQLVYRAYLDETGLNLNQGGGIVFPIDLVQSSNTYTVYTKGV